MVQSNWRSVPLRPAGFTSPPVTNRGNRIRVLSPQALLQLTVQECIVLGFMESVYMRLPVWPAPPWFQSPEVTPPVGGGKPTIETVSVERLIATTQKNAENRLTVVLPHSPDRLLQCRVKNILVNKTTGPDATGCKQYATVVYSYDIEVKYRDRAGQMKKATFSSGTRQFRTVLPPRAKTVNVSVHCSCTFC